MLTNYENTKLYPVKNVKKGYYFYLKILFEKCLGIFKYKKLPKSLPAREIEKRLIWLGFSGIFNHSKYKLTACDGGLSGVNQYYMPTDFTYAQPALGSGVKKIGDDCVIIYNTQSDTIEPYGLRELIMRYARLLADVDSTLDIQIINTRATKLNSVADDNTAKVVNNAMQAIEAGENYTINQQSLIDRWIPKEWNTAHPDTLEKIIYAKQSILNAFLEEIGVKSINEKRERMITDEVTADNQLLMVNLDDLLYMRKEGIEEVNEMFGTDIEVELNDIYNISKNIMSIGGANNDTSIGIFEE